MLNGPSVKILLFVQVSACIETLCKYLQNIVANPTEEKYKRIRLSNKVFQEKVACLEGTMEFLTAAGFEQKRLPSGETEEDFLVFGDVTEEAIENIQASKTLKIISF